MLFSSTEYADIDEEKKSNFEDFFADLNLDEEDPVVNKVRFAQIMNDIDWNNRWVYKGSQTLPPCSKFVYWNVIETIYPVREEVLQKFKKKLKDMGVSVGEDGEKEYGNYRNINKKMNKEVYFITSGAIKVVIGVMSVMVGVGLVVI